MEHQKITSFNQITVPDNSLIVLDIDETTLKYCDINKEWWKKTFKYYYEIHDCYKKADELCESDWKQYIDTNLPTHTDEKGFFLLLDLCKKRNCELIMVTARNDKFKGITHEHLNYLGIFDIEVYFSEGRNKGTTIKEIIGEDHKYSNMIFIDDIKHNLDNVKKVFGNGVTCYQFQIEAVQQ